MAAYNVSRRMKELGIRVALGARAKHVMSAAVGRPIVLLVARIAGGTAVRRHRQPVAGAHRVSGESADPVVVGGAVLIMVFLGVAACTIPALRALAVDPSKLLREE
jgi:ABC-type lipoprotein release transport system permease subunit